MSLEGPIRDGNIAGLELIETMRWEPGLGFRRIDRHLARMGQSAVALGFAFSREAALDALDGAVGGERDLRVRLALGEGAVFSVTVQDFVEQPADAVWTLRVARSLIDSRYGLLRHKTTRRGFYEAARAEYPRKVADEVILTNERGEVCDGTITNVFVDDGGRILLTPSLSCGLLPGVLRAEMLDQGKAREAILTRDDLYEAKAVYVGNSLRGMIRGKLPGA